MLSKSISIVLYLLPVLNSKSYDGGLYRLDSQKHRTRRWSYVCDERIRTCYHHTRRKTYVCDAWSPLQLGTWLHPGALPELPWTLTPAWCRSSSWLVEPRVLVLVLSLVPIGCLYMDLFFGGCRRSSLVQVVMVGPLCSILQASHHAGSEYVCC